MNKEKIYVKIIKDELITAYGCTDPVAVGYAASTGSEILGCLPEKIQLTCSGNIIKNCKSVLVPNSNGLRGTDAAATLGAAIGRQSKGLEVFDGVTCQQLENCNKMLRRSCCSTASKMDADKLYIEVYMEAGNASSRVIIAYDYSNIVLIQKNEEVLVEKELPKEEDEQSRDYDHLSIDGILTFVDNAPLPLLKKIFKKQVRLNSAISQEGLDKEYGCAVGKTLSETLDLSLPANRIKAMTACGVDARMGGSSLPVVINSGSGNQGITSSVPIIEYVGMTGRREDDLYRGLAVSNLVAIHIKNRIGRLSSFCGAVSAACGSGAAMTYLNGGGYDEVCSTISNALGNTSGIFCDGAKSSCAAKVSSSLDGAILAHEMTMRGRTFQSGDGIITGDIEKTIDCLGVIAQKGMTLTDEKIIQLLVEGTLC